MRMVTQRLDHIGSLVDMIFDIRLLQQHAEGQSTHPSTHNKDLGSFGTSARAVLLRGDRGLFSMLFSADECQDESDASWK